jgi:hypothetical protein
VGRKFLKIRSKKGKAMIVKHVNFLTSGKKNLFEISKFSQGNLDKYTSIFIAKKTA